jgi:8-oxo-dGTP pyrophosphatase MutT (NUDIX family)
MPSRAAGAKKYTGKDEQIGVRYKIPKSEPGRRAPRPKLAATIVLVRDTAGQPEILMGKRSAKHDFMPSIFVFPGGRVDPSDSYAPSHDHINTRTREILETAMPPARARACAMAAVRETFEETALVLGEPYDVRPRAINDPSWKAFHASGHIPVLSGIEVMGRAITPPHRHKRFDTWFFLARLDAGTASRRIGVSNELIELDWFNFDQIKDLEMHRMTEIMIDVTKKHLDADHLPNRVFFSRAVHGNLIFSDYPD